MKLVEDWKKAWRMWSVQAMIVAGMVQSVWMTLPPNMQASLPESWLRGITIALLVIGVVGRLIEQPKLREGES